MLGVLLATEATRNFKTIKDTVITPLETEASCGMLMILGF